MTSAPSIVSRNLDAATVGPAALAAMRRITDPARDAKRLYQQSSAAGLPKHLAARKENLPIARDLRGRIPSSGEMMGVVSALDAAITAPLDKKSASIMVRTMLDAFGREAKGNAPALVAALVMTVCDEAEINDLIGIETAKVSPIILALACLKLIKTCTFHPTASELRNACLDVRERLSDLSRWLSRVYEVVCIVEEILIQYGEPYEWPENSPPNDGLDDDVDAIVASGR